MQDFGQPVEGQGPPPPPGYGGPPPPPGYGGYPPPPPPGAPPPPPGYGAPAPTKWGLVAGIMLIIGGVIGLLFGIWMLTIILWAESITGGMIIGGAGWVYICAILPLLGGIFGLIGGIMSIKRKAWALCLVGSILLIPGWSFIFGLLGLIFLVLGKKEFR